MTCRFVHIHRVPVYNRSNDKVERHGPFLLRIWRSVINVPLRMGKNGFCQSVAGFAFIQARLAFLTQLRVFYPVQHEQSALNSADFTKGQVETVLLAVGSKFSQ